MKHSFLLLFGIFFIILSGMPNTSRAQNKNRASIEIILSDQGYHRVNINDREFDEVNKRIYINDIPAGRIYLEVIKMCGSQEELFCNQSVFYGYINLEKNKHYQAVVLVGEEEIVVSDKNDLFDKNIDLDAAPSERGETADILPTEVILEHRQVLSVFWKNIYDNMTAKETDTERKNVLNAALRQNKSIKAGELLPLLATMLFDDSKAEALKESYQFISDQQNIQLLRYAFNLESNYHEVIGSLR